MLNLTKRTSFRISSVSSKMEPEPDLQTGYGQNVPTPQHCMYGKTLPASSAYSLPPPPPPPVQVLRPGGLGDAPHEFALLVISLCMKAINAKDPSILARVVLSQVTFSMFPLAKNHRRIETESKAKCRRFGLGGARSYAALGNFGVNV